MQQTKIAPDVQAHLDQTTFNPKKWGELLRKYEGIRDTRDGPWAQPSINALLAHGEKNIKSSMTEANNTINSRRAKPPKRDISHCA